MGRLKEIQVCSIEDLIIFKLVAARPIDYADAEMLVERYCNELETDYLVKTAREFAQIERSDVFDHLKEYLNKYT